MDKQRLGQIFRHLLRDILNETDEELGMPYDEIASYMADWSLKLSMNDELMRDDHAFDAELRKARNDVRAFAGLNGSHPDHRHILGSIQGAIAVGARAL